jgi:hypothetical protein
MPTIETKAIPKKIHLLGMDIYPRETEKLEAFLASSKKWQTLNPDAEVIVWSHRELLFFKHHDKIKKFCEDNNITFKKIPVIPYAPPETLSNWLSARYEFQRAIYTAIRSILSLTILKNEGGIYVDSNIEASKIAKYEFFNGCFLPYDARAIGSNTTRNFRADPRDISHKRYDGSNDLLGATANHEIITQALATLEKQHAYNFARIRELMEQLRDEINDQAILRPIQLALAIKATNLVLKDVISSSRTPTPAHEQLAVVDTSISYQFVKQADGEAKDVYRMQGRPNTVLSSEEVAELEHLLPEEFKQQVATERAWGTEQLALGKNLVVSKQVSTPYSYHPALGISSQRNIHPLTKAANPKYSRMGLLELENHLRNKFSITEDQARASNSQGGGAGAGAGAQEATRVTSKSPSFFASPQAKKEVELVKMLTPYNIDTVENFKELLDSIKARLKEKYHDGPYKAGFKFNEENFQLEIIFTNNIAREDMITAIKASVAEMNQPPSAIATPG